MHAIMEVLKIKARNMTKISASANKTAQICSKAAICEFATSKKDEVQGANIFKIIVKREVKGRSKEDQKKTKAKLFGFS